MTGPGFYIGGHVRIRLGQKGLADTFGLDASSRPNGFLAGGQIGYNYQIGQFVLASRPTLVERHQGGTDRIGRRHQQ